MKNRFDKTKVMICLIVILILFVLGLSGYIIYDRFVVDNNNYSDICDNDTDNSGINWKSVFKNNSKNDDTDNKTDTNNSNNNVIQSIEVPDYVKKLSNYVPATLYRVYVEEPVKYISNFTDSTIVKLALYHTTPEKREFLITEEFAPEDSYIELFEEHDKSFGGVVVKAGDKVKLDAYSRENVSKQIDAMFGVGVSSNIEFPKSIGFTVCNDINYFMTIDNYYVRGMAQIGTYTTIAKAITSYNEDDNNLFIYYEVCEYTTEINRIIKVKETFEKDSSGNFIWKQIELIG